LHLTPLAAEEEDPQVAKLRAALDRRIGEAQLPELILAVATASLGLATHRASSPFTSVGQLLAAADRSVYAAKASSRDRLVC
jgi:hypothetical protein